MGKDIGLLCSYLIDSVFKKRTKKKYYMVYKKRD